LDANRYVDSSQHDVSDRCRINRPEICRHVNLRDAIQIAHASVDNQTSSVCGLVHVKEEIVSDDGSIHLFPEHIDDQHIAGLEHVDGGLIVEVGKSLCLCFGL